MTDAVLEAFLLRTALRDLLRPRRLAVALLLIGGPAAIGVLIRIAAATRFDGVATYGGLASLLVFGFVLPILSVVFGTGVITQEMEEKTVVYILTRPVARWRILLSKFVAAWLVTSLTSVSATVLVAAATHQPGSGSGQVRLYPEAILQPASLCASLQLPETPVAEYLQERLSPQTLRRLNAWDPSKQPGRRLLQRVINDLNAVISKDRSLYTSQRFAGVELPEDVRQLIAERATGEALARRNRLLLEAAFPGVFRPYRTTLAQLPRDILILPIGALAYAAVSLLLATMMNRALVVGLFLAFGWESWVPLLPGNFRLVSVMTYLRALAPHARPESASTDLMSLFSAMNPETVPASLAWSVLGGVCLCSLLLATAIFSIREYVPREDTQ